MKAPKECSRDDRGLRLIEAKAHHGELQKEECGNVPLADPASCGTAGVSFTKPNGEIPVDVDLDSKLNENRSMKTTVDIPENELKDAMRFTKARTKREAVVKVLEEFNRRRRMAELVKYAGSFSDRFPTNDEIEAVDTIRDGALNARPRR